MPVHRARTKGRLEVGSINGSFRRSFHYCFVAQTELARTKPSAQEIYEESEVFGIIVFYFNADPQQWFRKLTIGLSPRRCLLDESYGSKLAQLLRSCLRRD